MKTTKYQEGGKSKYTKRNLKKAERLQKKADKRKKYWSDYDKEMDEMHGKGNWESGTIRLFTGKRAAKRAQRARDKAEAGSRKAYREGRKSGKYKQTGGVKSSEEIKAFQKEYNKNNPNKKIAEDGIQGPETTKAMNESKTKKRAGGAKKMMYKSGGFLEPATPNLDDI